MWQSGSQGASLWRVSFEQLRGDFDRRRLYYGTGLGTPATSVTVLPARRSELL